MAESIDKPSDKRARKAKASRTPTPKGTKRGDAQQTELIIGLHDGGMTPMLRAGVGGLAASLRAMLLEDHPDADWPSPVKVGSAEVSVEPTRVVFRFNGEEPSIVLESVFARSFVVRRPEGLIHLPGAFDLFITRQLPLAVALQSGLKRTFLQHGKSTEKLGAAVTKETDIDDKRTRVNYQPYASFAHQTAYEDVLNAMRSGGVQLAGWAYPGNAGRHNGFKADTDWRYTAPQALAGIFSLVGCLSFEIPRSGGAGALVIVEPSDLVQYAITRPHLTPRKLSEAYLTGTGDAVLAVQLLLRAEELVRRAGVAAVHGVTLRATPWASQQKSRVSTISIHSTSIENLDLDLYERVQQTLPTKIVTTSADDTREDDSEERGFYPATSALRRFVTENIAARKRWFTDFATAMTPEKKPRLIHYYRARDAKNLGALYPDERGGLIAMVEHLKEAEQVLVRSVHQALRQRFGAIAKDTENLSLETRKNRWKGERERLRLAFAGAKTPEQARAALADLWSRAGANAELRKNWELVLPLLRPTHWQAARDLSLVALASYTGVTANGFEDTDDTLDVDQQGDE